MKRYQHGDVVDMDDVSISPAAFARWQAVALMGAQALARIAPSGGYAIPDEQGLWLASGELEIFVEVVIGQQKPVRISQKIPPDEWVWADPQKRD